MDIKKLCLLMVTLLSLILGLLACTEHVDSTIEPEVQEPADSAGAILLFIGDGMGEQHRTAARWAGYGQQGQLVMDTLPITGMLHTAPYGGIGVTDSAAAGTALATGVKTYNGYIGMDHLGVSVPSILKIAKERGFAVGLVTTTQLGHATPACFAANVQNRQQMTEIVDQMLMVGVDVMLGGGEDDFLPSTENGCYAGQGHRTDNRNLLDAARDAGYTVLCKPDELTTQLALTATQVLGVFGDDGMLRPHAPSLAEMTAFAIEILSNDPEGFFLMVEGGQIDWAAHDNDAAVVISDTLAFDAAVAEGITYQNTVTDALIIVTADHETGGMKVSLEDSTKPGQDGPFQMPNGTSFYVTWSSISHTGADVPLTAQGVCADELHGSFENTHVFDVMLHALDGCPQTVGGYQERRYFLPYILLINHFD